MSLSPEQLRRAWTDFKVGQDPNARVEIINHFAYLVKITAGRLVQSLPGGLDRDDLMSAGVVGLIKAVDQFDPTRDVKFETYAIALVRGSVLEMLRDADWVPRSIREKLRALEKAQRDLERTSGHPPSEREIAEEMGVSTQEVSELLVRVGRTNVYSLDDILMGTEGDEAINYKDMLVDEDADPRGEMEGREIRKLLGEGIDRLPERERLVVALYYYEGLTFKEIGRVLTVSESRVYQLHTQAMGRMRNYMQQEGGLQVR